MKIDRYRDLIVIKHDLNNTRIDYYTDLIHLYTQYSSHSSLFITYIPSESLILK